jgi:hypothetical protein
MASGIRAASEVITENMSSFDFLWDQWHMLPSLGPVSLCLQNTTQPTNPLPTQHLSLYGHDSI